jgi:transcriptional regulator of aromatic amino acid metabolism
MKSVTFVDADQARSRSQEKFERLGGTSTVRANVRLITATNKPEKAMAEGKFREDHGLSAERFHDFCIPIA